MQKQKAVNFCSVCLEVEDYEGLLRLQIKQQDRKTGNKVIITWYVCLKCATKVISFIEHSQEKLGAKKRKELSNLEDTFRKEGKL